MLNVDRSPQEIQWDFIKRSILATTSNLVAAQSAMAAESQDAFFLEKVQATASRLVTGFRSQIIDNPDVDKVLLRAYIETNTDNADPITQIQDYISECETVVLQIQSYLNSLPKASPAQSLPVQNTIQRIKDIVTGF